jgi:hypothetical protein
MQIIRDLKSERALEDLLQRLAKAFWAPIFSELLFVINEIWEKYTAFK